MRKLLIGMVLVVVGCSGTSTSSEDGEDCVRLVIERAAELTEQYENGELSGADEAFLDKYGKNTSMIPARVHVAEEVAGCEWVDDEVQEGE